MPSSRKTYETQPKGEVHQRWKFIPKIPVLWPCLYAPCPTLFCLPAALILGRCLAASYDLQVHLRSGPPGFDTYRQDTGDVIVPAVSPRGSRGPAQCRTATPGPTGSSPAGGRTGGDVPHIVLSSWSRSLHDIPRLWHFVLSHRGDQAFGGPPTPMR